MTILVGRFAYPLELLHPKNPTNPLIADTRSTARRKKRERSTVDAVTFNTPSLNQQMVATLTSNGAEAILVYERICLSAAEIRSIALPMFTYNSL